MDFIFSVIPIGVGVAVLLIVGAAALVIVQRGQPAVTIDLRELYFLIVSLFTLLMAFFSLTGIMGSILDLALRTYEPIPTPLSPPIGPREEMPPVAELQPYDPTLWIREQIAQAGAATLIAIPVWAFHWQRARRLAEEKGPSLLHRLYLYGIMILALLFVIGSATGLLTQILRAVVGAIDWGDVYQQRFFWKNVLSTLISALLAGTIWAYHFLLVNRLPTEEKSQ